MGRKNENVEVEAISSIFTADANTTIKFEVDNSLVAGYNEANGTELFSMEGVTIEDAVILPGEKVLRSVSMCLNTAN